MPEMERYRCSVEVGMEHVAVFHFKLQHPINRSDCIAATLRKRLVFARMPHLMKSACSSSPHHHWSKSHQRKEKNRKDSCIIVNRNQIIASLSACAYPGLCPRCHRCHPPKTGGIFPQNHHHLTMLEFSLLKDPLRAQVFFCRARRIARASRP